MMEKIQLSRIKFYDNNAKKHPPEQIEKIKRSIQQFGFRGGVKVTPDLTLIAGHGRVIALREMGVLEVEVEVIEDLKPEDIKAYRLADNRTAESKWDENFLAQEMQELQDSNYDLSLTGFDDNEISKLIDSLVEKGANDDTVPENPPMRAKLGDVWQLGKHRLMCGDSTSLKDVETLMGGGKADMVFTDPPYNVNYKGTGKNTSNTILNDKMSVDDFGKFMVAVFEAYKIAVKKSAAFYVCHSSSSQRIFEDAMELTGLKVKTQIIWNKTIASMGWGDYRWKHEPIFYATYEGKAVNFYGDRCNVTVWNESWDMAKNEENLKKIAEKQEKGGSTIWSIGRESNYKHPTQKPVELVSIAIKNSSKAEDIVLDLFGGSGSCLIACEKLDRINYSMELDEKYCDVIICRWEEFTGQIAQKL